MSRDLSPTELLLGYPTEALALPDALAELIHQLTCLASTADYLSKALDRLARRPFSRERQGWVETFAEQLHGDVGNFLQWVSPWADTYQEGRAAVYGFRRQVKLVDLYEDENPTGGAQ